MGDSVIRSESICGDRGPHGVQPEGPPPSHWMKRWLLEEDVPVEPIELQLQEASAVMHRDGAGVN